MAFFFPKPFEQHLHQNESFTPPSIFCGKKRNMFKKHLCIDEIFFGEGFSYGVLRWGWVSLSEFRWDPKSSSNFVSFNKANRHPQLPQSHRIGKGLVFLYIYIWMIDHSYMYPLIYDWKEPTIHCQVKYENHFLPSGSWEWKLSPAISGTFEADDVPAFPKQNCYI